MLAIDRTIVKRGPCVLLFRGQTLYTKADVKVEPDLKTFNVEVSNYGKVDEREDTQAWKVSFTPAGMPAPAFACLFPYYTLAYGSGVIPSSDADLVIHSLADGKSLTIFGAAVTKMPDLDFTGNRTMFGACEITGAGKNNNVDTDAAHRIAIATETYTASGYSTADIVTQGYTVAWGAAPFDDLKTADGVKIAHSPTLTPETASGIGLYDWTYGGLDMTATLQPLNVTKEQILARNVTEGAGAGQGRSLSASGYDLVVSGTGVYFILYGAAAKNTPFEFGLTKKHVGEVTLISTRTNLAKVAYIGAAAPV